MADNKLAGCRVKLREELEQSNLQMPPGLKASVFSGAAVAPGNFAMLRML
jgi:hypothetical protein